MSKPSAPPRAPTPEDELSIDIDPSLIEAALAAVDRRLGHAADTASPAEIELEVEPQPRPAPVVDEEKRRLHVRVQEQAEQIRKLEREVARMTEARDGLDKQARDLRKSLGELEAEFERYRARARKDAEEAERRGEERSLRPLVEVFDNVERARQHAMSDPAHIVSGLQMIMDQFRRLLTRVGFERVAAERGIPFDPACHEAMLHVPSADAAPGSVLDEVQAGFRLRGRLFRPARVTVAAPPPEAAG
jgi:molecular chaperone GrpE